MPSTTLRNTAACGTACVALLLAAAPPAGAAAPVRQVLDLSGTFVDEELCEFPVVVVTGGEATRLRHVDADGTLRGVTIVPHGPFTESWSANGTTIDITYRPNLRFVAEDGRIVRVVRLGLFANTPVPGLGQLYVEAGQLSYDSATGEVLSAAGLWPTLALTDVEGLAPVCEFLS